MTLVDAMMGKGDIGGLKLIDCLCSWRSFGCWTGDDEVSELKEKRWYVVDSGVE